MPAHTERHTDHGPLRMVVFTGGAVLEPAVIAFLRRLEASPEIELAGVFCQAEARGLAGVTRDLWRRRRLLAPLLLAQRGLRFVGRAVSAPGRLIGDRRLARRLGPVVHFVADLHAPAVLDEVASLRPDLGAVYGGPILKRALYSIPARGTLGIHHGRVPDYRGKKTTFWAMYQGEDVVGVTIQRIGGGLDAGDVLLQGELPVGTAPLWLVRRRLDQLGLGLYLEAILRVRRGEAVFHPQPDGPGRLYRDPGVADILRFWARYLRRLAAPGRPRR